MLSINEGNVKTRSAATIGPAPWIETEIPGPLSRTVIEQDHAACAPVYQRAYPLAVRRALGTVVEDMDGNRFLDFASGIAVCSTGHCHPKVVHAIQDQAADLIHACGAMFYTQPAAALMVKLARIAPFKNGARVFLSNSGTEAMEGAIKLARKHTGRQWLIAFEGAFHGRTTGALALTCSKAGQKAGFGPLMPMVAHVPYNDIDAIENKLFKQQMLPEEVAAIFVEPIQGEGGYTVADQHFMTRLRSLCDKHRIVLVADEIQTGFGRTGRWWGCQHFGVTPDIIVAAKGIASGMPLGALIAREEVSTWGPRTHGSTYGGSPVPCAAALATIDLLESGFMQNAAIMGERMRQGLQGIADSRKVLRDVRGFGLMIGVDVVSRRTGKLDAARRGKILQECFQRGLILLGCGESAIRIIPPLCINEAQVDVGLKVLDEAIATVI